MYKSILNVIYKPTLHVWVEVWLTAAESSRGKSRHFQTRGSEKFSDKRGMLPSPTIPSFMPCKTLSFQRLTSLVFSCFCMHVEYSEKACLRGNRGKERLTKPWVPLSIPCPKTFMFTYYSLLSCSAKHFNQNFISFIMFIHTLSPKNPPLHSQQHT